MVTGEYDHVVFATIMGDQSDVFHAGSVALGARCSAIFPVVRTPLATGTHCQSTAQATITLV
jgi:hypothetical protein